MLHQRLSQVQMSFHPHPLSLPLGEGAGRDKAKLIQTMRLEQFSLKHHARYRYHRGVIFIRWAGSVGHALPFCGP